MTAAVRKQDGAELVKNYRKTLKLQSMMAAEGIPRSELRGGDDYVAW